MTKKLLLNYIDDENYEFKVEVDDYDTVYITNVKENFTNEIESWQDPDYDIALLLGLYHIKKFKRSSKDLDVSRENLEKVMDYLNDCGTKRQIENFIDNLSILEFINPYATNLREYLLSIRPQKKVGLRKRRKDAI